MGAAAGMAEARLGRRRWRSAARALRIIHPFPTMLNVAATAALAVVASNGMPPGPLLARMLVVMFLAQAAVGTVNDIFDRELDAATKPWKPLAAGIVSPRAAGALAAALLLAMLALAATLGAAGCTLAVAGAACGLAYDARLKRTALSALPFMVAVPVLPMWVWTTLGEWRAVLWWLAPLGALIGVALHLANTAPDIEGDAAQGVRGVAHALGADGAMRVAWMALAAALALSAAIAPIVRYDWRAYAPTLAAGGAILVAGVTVGRGQTRVMFALLGVGSVVLAAGWLAAVT